MQLKWRNLTRIWFKSDCRANIVCVIWSHLCSTSLCQIKSNSMDFSQCSLNAISIKEKTSMVSSKQYCGARFWNLWKVVVIPSDQFLWMNHELVWEMWETQVKIHAFLEHLNIAFHHVIDGRSSGRSFNRIWCRNLTQNSVWTHFFHF